MEIRDQKIIIGQQGKRVRVVEAVIAEVHKLERARVVKTASVRIANQ